MIPSVGFALPDAPVAVTTDRFHENHPVLGHRMVARIDAWKTVLAKHPSLRHDVRHLRADRREFRHDLRELRRDVRH